MNNWLQKKLGDTKISFIDGDRSARYPSRSEFVNSEVMFLNAESIKSGRIDQSSVNHITKTKFETITKGRIRKYDILMTTRGNGIGDVAFVDTNESGLINAQMLILRNNPEEINSLYLYYFLKTKYSKEQIGIFSSGSAQPQIPIRDLKHLPVILPPLPVQCKIAAVLSAYDELIENNNHRITILEKMAEELYREWFVRLRFPGHEKVKIIKGVPEGWEVKKLSEIIELAYGKALKEENRIEGKYPVFGSSGVVGFHNQAIVKGPGIIVGRKGNVGNVLLSNEDFYPIDTVYYVKSALPIEYLFYLIQSMNFINNDAAVPGLNREQAYSNKFYFPKEFLINKFEEIVKPYFKQKWALKDKNVILTISRARLLSRLMSGKIDVEHLDIAFPKSMEHENTLAGSMSGGSAYV